MITSEEKDKLVAGYRQVVKALSAKSCKKLLIAEDCSERISEELKALAAGVEIVSVPSMRELGNICGIDVPSSCAAIRL